MFNNNLLMGAAAVSGADLVSVGNSALYITDDNSTLTRTPLTAGNRDTWTFSTWVYRTLYNSEENVFCAGADDNNRTGLKFNAHDILYYHFDGGGVTDQLNGTAVYRDTGWYHIVLAVDTTQAVESNRVIIYVNGERVTAFDTANYPTQNTDTDVNSTAVHTIGASPAGTNDLEAYLAETVLIDGLQLAPTSFGTYDSSGLYWTPLSSDTIKELTFGTNGFYLSNATDLSSNMTTFVDSGPTGHTITTGGNTTHSPLGHKVQNSVIYVDGTTDYISVAPSGHSDFTLGTGDFCIEGWFNRIALSGTSNYSYMFDFRYASNDAARPACYMDGSNNISYDVGNVNKIISTTDPTTGAWYHLAIARNSGTTTMYLNGTSVGSFSDSTDYLVGRPWFFEYPQSNAYCFNGYATELRISKGVPRYTGNFTPSTTAFASDSNTSLLVHSNKDFGVANDDTGNGNNFVNSSVTKTTHTPTNMQALWNPNFKNSTAGSPLLTNGNKTIQVSSTSEVRVGQNLLIPTVGKWIMGVSQAAVNDTGKAFGIWTTLTQTTGFPSVTGLGGWHITSSTNAYQCDGTHIVTISSPQTADQFWICADVDNSKIFFGFWDNSASSITWYAADGGGDGNPVSGANPSQSIDVGGATFGGTGYNNKTFTLVEEADIPFTIPTGYKFLNTTNIASATTRTASDTTKYFETILYEGTGSEQNVVSDTTTNTSAFSWIKNRDATDNHMLFDRVRGATKDLHSNTNDIEVTNAQTVKAFIGGGVTLGTDAEVNTSSESFALWNWMIGTSGSGSSNEDGSINTTATLVDTTLGLSISKYTGTGSNATVGHGLGVVPTMMFIKNLGVTDSWAVYYGDNTDYLVLNTATGTVDDNTMWNDTTPTSSVFSIGSNHQVNASSENYIAYCFANSQFISVGTFTGNENTNGPFVPTINSAGVPLQPVWIMIKNSVQARSWNITDTARNPYNVANLILEADTTTAQQTGSDTLWNMDIVTGGFKLRSSHETSNGAETMVYMAIGTPIIDTSGRIIAGR